MSIIWRGSWRKWSERKRGNWTPWEERRETCCTQPRWCLFVCLSTCLSACLVACLSVCLSFYLSLYRSVWRSILSRIYILFCCFYLFFVHLFQMLKEKKPLADWSNITGSAPCMISLSPVANNKPTKVVHGLPWKPLVIDRFRLCSPPTGTLSGVLQFTTEATPPRQPSPWQTSQWEASLSSRCLNGPLGWQCYSCHGECCHVVGCFNVSCGLG